ncbi:RHS repeat-associated core domain-containing protein [Inquilinus sp. NPDC058860]|uniref:RHS repeat-associated core domain-containing protein n=1 Tax=Inquilinus sp. NPDC058860 TaxID=3346652 RepID=UPI0036CAABA1
MMLAVTHFDPVIGVDIHMIQPPGPVPPVPVPHPYIGLVFDVFDYLPIFGSTIKVNNLHRAIAGTEGKAIPPHIPIGGVFVPPLPWNEHENFMGSLTVGFDDDAATYLALPALSCQSMGIPSIPRRSKKSKPSLKSLVLPTSVVLSIPKGPPVFIGGPPTISLFALGGRLVLGLVGRALKWARRTKPGRALDDLFKRGASRAHQAWRKAFKNMPSGFLKCKVLRAEPVDIRTGEVVVDQEDFSLPGRIPLRWTRHYGSNSTRMGVCGLGWETPADARLELQPDGSVVFSDGEGAGALFDALPTKGPVHEPVDGWRLDRDEDRYTVRRKGGLTYAFPAPSQPWREILVETLTDPCGNTLRYLRGPDGLEQMVESAGRRLEIVSEFGLVQHIVLYHPDFAEERCCLARFDYDPAGRLTAVYDALGHPYTFGYGDADPGRLVRHTNRTGHSFYYEYDEAGRCIHSWGDGGLYDYHFDYDPEGRWTNYVDSLGHPWSAELDARGQILREIDPLGGITSYVYDEAGRTTAVTDPAGHTTQYRYDERGNLFELIRADGVSILCEFDQNDKPIRIIDPNGVLWRQYWNENGLLVKQESPTGFITTYYYDEEGELYRYNNSQGNNIYFQSDKFGNLYYLSDSLGNICKLKYDCMGNLTERIDPLNKVSVYEYDVKGRLVRVTFPDKSKSECSYDTNDNLISYSDQNGDVTNFLSSKNGKIERRVQADGHSVECHYDSEERLINIRNQNDQIYMVERDSLGRIINELDYWGQKRSYTYDAAGDLRESVDPLGRITRYEYDPLGRVRRKILPHHDKTDQVWIENFDFDANGNLIKMSNPYVAIERHFDIEGTLLREVQGGFIINYRYNRKRRLTGYKTNTGNSVDYECDELDRPTAVLINDEAVVRFQWDKRGQISREVLRDGLIRQYLYDDNGLTTSQIVTRDDKLLNDIRYDYDQVGNLLQRRDSQYGVDQYRYSSTGQILEHIDSGGNTARFLNDPIGDRLTTRIRNPEARRSFAEHEVPGSEWRREGSYGDVHYSFDRAGNLVGRNDAERATRLTWDANQRLIRTETNGVVTTYGYDPLGRRVFKETEGRRTCFGWDGNRMIVEYGDNKDGGESDIDSNGYRSREHVYFLNSFVPIILMEMVGFRGESNSIRSMNYYQNDINGRPIKIMNENGDILWHSQYSIFGKQNNFDQHAMIENTFGFQGQYYDRETGLYYNRYRYFDPEIGQFISEDPLGLSAGANSFFYAPNAISWIDPLGLDESGRGKPHELFAWVEDELGRPIVNFPDDPATFKDLFSGGQTKAVAGPYGLGSHTEPLYLKSLQIARIVIPGDLVRMIGAKDPCPNCQSILKDFVNRTPAGVLYSSDETGDWRHWHFRRPRPGEFPRALPEVVLEITDSNGQVVRKMRYRRTRSGRWRGTRC